MEMTSWNLMSHGGCRFRRMNRLHFLLTCKNRVRRSSGDLLQSEDAVSGTAESLAVFDSVILMLKKA